ncbi:hypothetical protein ZEAMMB73_Zm00001d011260 [Zea mays]|uniref:Uncharacterized protein n=1 Tax=Zea mays TaxID=4577 RepID=A0A1D6FYF6_MAIZE|nr:hypothetical protein ZEAMMB73_Zm00001d011260 [Zea mays]
MASVKAYVLLLFTAFFSGLMKLSTAAQKPATITETARLIDAKGIDQAIAYLLMRAACVFLFTAFFFSGLMQLSMAAQLEKPVAAARVVVDAKTIDQAIAYLLMLAALFVTYLAH